MKSIYYISIAFIMLIVVSCTSNPYVLKGGELTFDGERVILDENHLLLDGSVSDVEIEQMSYCFNDITDVVEYLNSSNDTLPTYLYVAPWVYWVDNPDTPEVKYADGFPVPLGQTIRHDKLNIIGLTEHAEDVVFASARGQMQGAYGNFTMLRFIGDDLTLRNVTLGNYCNVDLEYEYNPELSRAKRNEAITQAQLAFVEGDRAQAHNCRFISRLNTCPLNGAKRTLFVDCHFEMTDDALEGQGVYVGCDFDFYGGKPFYSTYGVGAILLDCDFNIKHRERQCFTKVEGQVVAVDCRYNNPNDVPIDWNINPSGRCFCYQHNITNNGKPYVMPGGVSGATVVMDDIPLLRAYKLESGEYNLYNLLAGDDGWNPMNVSVSKRIPLMMTLQNEVDTVIKGGEAKVNKAMFHWAGGYEDHNYLRRVKWNILRNIDALKLGGGNDVDTVLIIGNNNGLRDTMSVVAATSIVGHRAVMQVETKPSLIEEPIVNKAPMIVREGNSLRVDYQLAAESGEDKSEVVWYREVEGCRYPLAQSHGNPTSCYVLQPSDNRHAIVAEMEIATNRSINSKRFTLRTTDTSNDIASTTYSTDFKTFPTITQRDVKSGLWTIDWNKPKDVEKYNWGGIDHSKPYWVYAPGIDGTKGRIGLMQAQKGARMLYTPEDKQYGDMKVTWELSPCKNAGQGFGSATGQYLDLYIKFDTRTLTGYALRIERTPDSSSSVAFGFVEYRNGTVTPIGEPVMGRCFRPDCKIVMSVNGTTLSAHAVNTESSSFGEVSISAEVAANSNGGYGMQHTGSCGASAIMLNRLTVEYQK